MTTPKPSYTPEDNHSAARESMEEGQETDGLLVNEVHFLHALLTYLLNGLVNTPRTL
jgi:hypothetical protein